jgi:hypothetical protein
MLSVMAFLLLFSGCSLQSSQLSAVMGLLKPQDTELSLNSWSVKYANYEALVYPVTLPEGTLFSNKAGDQVFFDGWSIRQVKGMGRGGLHYQNTDSNNQRTFMRGNRKIAIHSCIAWQKQEQSGMIRFSQQCGDREPYVNSILVAKDGSIALIHQVVDDRYITVTLSKLN